MNKTVEYTLSKVPEVTIIFWIIKILATTLGETGGDTVTMTLNWGYLAGTALFFVTLVALVASQIVAKKFHPSLYWATIIASTTFGTTMADFADRSLGIGYTGGSSILLCCLLATLGLWYWWLGLAWLGLARYRWTLSVRQEWKFSIGLRSRFRKPWGRPWVIGWPIQRVLDTKAARSYSVPLWQSSQRPTIGQKYHG